MVARLVQDESTPFSKILLMLRSLRDSLPGFDKENTAGTDQPPARAAFDHHFIHPTATSPPLTRLDWCIEHLAEFVARKYAAPPNMRDSMSKIFRQKITTLDDNSEEFLQYLEENYTAHTAQSSLQRSRMRGHASPKDAAGRGELDVVHETIVLEGSRSLMDMSASLDLRSADAESGSEFTKLRPRKWIGAHEAGDAAVPPEQEEVRFPVRTSIASAPEPVHNSVFAEPLGQMDEGSSRALPSRVPRLIRIQRVRSAPTLSPHPMTLMPTFSEDCKRILADISPWGLDVFLLDKLSGCRPLLALGSEIFARSNLLQRLKLNPLIMARYLAALEDGYAHYPQILYHNNLHGADVMHSTYLLLQSPALAGAFSDLEMFSAILAAAAHDVGHPGVTNQFLVATQSPLAILYNDQAVLENHHTATAFKLMAQQDYNVLGALDRADQQATRSMVIEMIMNTDMARHFQFLANFRTLVETKRGDDGRIDMTQLRDEDRMLILCAIVHCADLAGTTKPWNICAEWCKRLLLEFFNQGDREAEAGLEVGPLHDRKKTSIPKSQVNFINFIAQPLWEVWDMLVGGNSLPLQLLKENRELWQRLAHEADAAIPRADSASHSQSSA